MSQYRHLVTNQAQGLFKWWSFERFLRVDILGEDVDAGLLPPVGQVGIGRASDDRTGQGLALAAYAHVLFVEHFGELAAADELPAEQGLVAQAAVHAGEQIVPTKPVVITTVEVDIVIITHGDRDSSSVGSAGITIACRTIFLGHVAMPQSFAESRLLGTHRL